MEHENEKLKEDMKEMKESLKSMKEDMKEFMFDLYSGIIEDEHIESEIKAGKSFDKIERLDIERPGFDSDKLKKVFEKYFKKSK